MRFMANHFPDLKYLILSIFWFFSLAVSYSQDKVIPFQQIIGPRSVSSHVGFLAGAWIPTSDLSVLGIHPSIGVQGGFRYMHSELDLTVSFRFLKAADSFVVYRPPYYYTLDNYFGGYIGLDYKYYFMADRQKEVGLMLGFGFEGFDINKGEEDYLDPVSINSFNFNIGIRINWFVSGRTYFGLQPRYNIVNYSNHGGTSLAGNAFSIDFFVGGWTPH